MDPLTPPPVRRIALDREPRVVPPRPLPAAPAGPATPAWPAGPGDTTRGDAGQGVHLNGNGSSPTHSIEVTERMRIESVSLAYADNWVVREVSLPVRQGEVLALIGASGSGKTTLLRSLNRLTEVTAGAGRSGRITLDGREIHELDVTELRRRVSMVFQQPNPFPMSIFENVAYALREHGRRRARRSRLQAEVLDALRRAGLYEEVADDLDRSA
ncbi:MAG TPA: ATP-binding cassette domain-containing protein, partial [Solirubrobacteraceae bacterium]|nr:ATP-binding cassette domain-containing protein [Solirubrobacteraceae bacterium]